MTHPPRLISEQNGPQMFCHGSPGSGHQLVCLSQKLHVLIIFIVIVAFCLLGSRGGSWNLSACGRREGNAPAHHRGPIGVFDNFLKGYLSSTLKVPCPILCFCPSDGLETRTLLRAELPPCWSNEDTWWFSCACLTTFYVCVSVGVCLCGFAQNCTKTFWTVAFWPGASLIKSNLFPCNCSCCCHCLHIHFYPAICFRHTFP